ncbi:MAG: GNAT family N-acetyltransferase [Chloroflexi bacterium]|nr:GNAT family N-acetyltransferase [Chloroflexota bacterium]
MEIRVGDEIVVRTLTMDDEATYFQWLKANRDHLARWLPFAATARSRSDVRMWLEQRTSPEELESRIGGLVYHQGELVGTANLKGIGSQDNAGELGYSLSESAQGKGIATRVCRKLIDIAFTEKEIHRVMIRGARGNRRSRAIPERLGFTFEGFQREAAFLQGNYHDLAVYSMLAQEWVDGKKGL